MEKKKILITLGCMIGLLFVIGISYAYWSLTFTQTENNVVMTDCFEIEFIEGNAINLSKAYPVIDSEGMKNVPYTFTIKNICDSSAKYQINLETLTPSGKKLPDQYLKANLTESNVSKITSKLERGLNSDLETIQRITTKLDKELNPKLNTEPTIEEAISAYKLYEGVLDPNETKEYNLRLWMHSDVTAEMTDSMNATYNGKISVITSYYQDNRGTLMAVNLDEESGGTLGAFWDHKEKITKVIFENELQVHEDAVHTFDVSETQDGSVMSYLVSNEDIETYTLYMQSEGGIKANPNSIFLFANFTSLKEIENLHFLDTSKVTDLSGMFSFCSSLTNLDLSSFDTSNVTGMNSMFYNCSSLANLNVSSFVTNYVTSMYGMFQNCSNLIDLDVSNFDTKNVRVMDFMFSGCERLEHLNLGLFASLRINASRNVFDSVPNTAIVKVLSEDTKNWVLSQNADLNVVVEV